MFSNFSPSIHRRYPVSVRELKSLCREARSLEEIALSWCSTKRSLFISRDVKHAPDIVTCIFLFKNRIIGSVVAKVDTINDQIPTVEPVDSHFTHHADGFRPHEQWFFERQNRLGLSICSVRDVTTAPPEAVPELTLSYCISKIGYAEILQAPRAEAESSVNLILNLVCIHKETQTGWSEQFYIDRSKLQASVQLQQAVEAGMMH